MSLLDQLNTISQRLDQCDAINKTRGKKEDLENGIEQDFEIESETDSTD